MKHFIIVGVLIVISTILLYLLFTMGGLLPTMASSQAITVDELFNLHFFLIAFLGSVILVFIGYSLVVFRSKPGDTTSGRFFKANNKLEVIWTLIPLAIVLALSYLGSVSLAETLRIDPQALEVKVTAFQWGWAFEYPSYGVTGTKLYLPVNKQVLLKMTSRDVIHSFWVPEFRVKQDILPGANLVKTLRITPTKIGTYQLLCAELCGGAHAYMTAPVIVANQAEFDQWIAQEMSATTADPAERGQKLSQANGCVSCHSLDGSKSVGSTWKGMAGGERELVDGSKVFADDVYLLESIVKPNLKIVKGYPANVMPATFSNTLSEKQLSDIVAYMKTIK